MIKLEAIYSVQYIHCVESCSKAENLKVKWKTVIFTKPDTY